MFFEGAVRSKLASLLQPWLEEEPEMELELGFLRSYGSAKNLSFDPLVLNPLIKESTSLLFREVKVKELSIHICPWSVPSLIVKVHGLDVTLALRESEDIQATRSRDLAAQKKKEAITYFDPEGAALHETLERHSDGASSGSRLMTSLVKVMLRCCQIQFQDICIRFQFVESHECLLKLDDFSLDSQLCNRSLLLRGFFGFFLFPGKNNFLSISCTKAEFGLKENNYINWITSVVGLSASGRLNNLHLLDCDIQVPQVDIKISPMVISLLLVLLDALSFKKSESECRLGKELWKIAIDKIGYSKLSPKLCFYKVAKMVLLWSWYVREYELLLLSVGYSTDQGIFKEKLASVSSDSKLLSTVKHQLRRTYELEKKLPAEAVARARRIACYRTLLQSSSPDLKSTTGFPSYLKLNIFSLVLLVWKAILFVFHLLQRFSYAWNLLNVNKGINSWPTLLDDASASQLQFTLNFGEVCVSVSPVSANHAPIYGNTGNEAKIPHLKSPFCLVVKYFCLVYSADSTVKTFFVACGEFKFCEASFLRVSEMKSDLGMSRYQSVDDSATESKIILWSDAALQYHPSEIDAVDCLKPAESASNFILKNNIGDLWSKWKKISGKHEEMNVKHKEQPFLLCELKAFLIDPYLRKGVYGHCKCGLTLGRVNFNLDYLSILSTALVFRQMQDCYQWTTRVGNLQTLKCSSSTKEETSVNRMDNVLESYTSKMKAAMLTIIPVKNIQVGVLIAGPKIRLSLQGAGEQESGPIIARESNSYCFSVDVQNIELAAWPASKVALAEISGLSIFDEVTSEYIWSKEPRKVDIAKAHANERYVSQGCVALDSCLKFSGLSVSLEDVEVNQLSDIVEVMSLTIQFSLCRKYQHSFSETVDVLSLALSGIIGDASVLFDMDELKTSLQVLEGMFTMGLSAHNSSEVTPCYSQELVRKLVTSARKNTERVMSDSGALDESIRRNTQILVDATLEFGAVDAILNNSRKNRFTGSSLKSSGASSSSTSYLGIAQVRKKTAVPNIFDFPDFGIGIFLQKSFIRISWEEIPLDLVLNLSGIKSVIFSHQSLMGISSNVSRIEELLEHSSEHTYQFSISSSVFGLHSGYCGDTLPSEISSDVNGFFFGDSRTLCATKVPHSVEGSEHQYGSSDHRLETDHLLTTSTPGEASGYWILVDIKLGEISVSGHYKKNMLAREHQPNKLKVLTFICEGLHTINCNIQGGYILIETSALAMFVHCFEAYILPITSSPLLMFNASRESLKKGSNSMVSSDRVAEPTNFPSEEYVAGSSAPASFSEAQEASKWNILKDLTVNMSQFTFTLAVKDGSAFQELIVELELKLKLLNSERKVLFDLYRLTVFTRHLHEHMVYQTRDSLMPHFRPNTSIASPSEVRSENCEFCSQATENVPIGLDSDHSASPTTSQRKLLLDNDAPNSSDHDSYILKHLSASVMVEKVILGSGMNFVQLWSDWLGNGSISGFDLAISVSEIQMLSALYEPLSGIFSAKDSHSVKQNTGSKTQGWMNNLDYTIPDGAVVAIKDLHQHMYFAAEAVDSKYHVVGALHYSLAGERALFKVKHHKRWGSHVSQISLISLYAKNDKGEPLRLNFSPGSGFVEISSSKDNRCALWEILPYKPDTSEDGYGYDVESYSISANKAFHLVNQKNKCAVAFVDGFPEFVKKPGNPLKAKVLNEFALTNDGRRLNVSSSYSGDTNHIQGELSRSGEASGSDSNLPYVNISIEKIAFTILHEVTDANDKFPLFRGCINDVCIIGQMLSSKIRIISSFNVTIHYMDAWKNIWKEIVSPVDSCLFFRSSSTHQDLVNVYQEIPIHLYFRIRQVDISLNEISLDILLYLAEKLNILGPYAVKSSMIFPNRCKLENHSGVSLLCQFPDNQEAVVAGKQSASIFLRHGSVIDQLSENESSVSLSLAEQGVFSTSPIKISMSNACFFTWRTRVVSLQDSRSFPGPFVVVEVLRKAEEDLTLTVSPLLRIHNESGLSMELCFRRPQETEGEAVYVLLKTGDTIDDSMAVFDALDLSGSSKKALMSLTLGNFLLTVRPEITTYTEKIGKSVSINWSDNLKGGKALRVSGIFDKLNYRLKKAIGVESINSSFSSLHCPLTIEGQHISDLHFLIHTIGRDVPVMHPPNVGNTSETRFSPVALQVQKEIFIYPTVQVYNLLQSDVVVLLTENHPDLCMTEKCYNIGKQATVPCSSSAYFYANPAMIYFTVTLTAYNSTCKTVNSADWLKKLHKQKAEVHSLDIELDFGGGKYFAFLRLSRADRGILEVTVFSTYTLQNNTEFSLLCSASDQQPIPWSDYGTNNSSLPPELGCFLPPKSLRSWFLKSNKLHFRWLEEKTSVALLDLDILSGFTELCLEAQDDFEVNRVAKLGVSLQPCPHKVCVPSQVVCIVPRYLIANESKESILVRQCYLQDDIGSFTSVEGQQKVTLQIRRKTSRSRETGFLHAILTKHRNVDEDSQIFVHFCLKENGYGWSGPVCVASLGRFFIKFKGHTASLASQMNPSKQHEKKSIRFAVIHVVEQNASLVLHFYMPPNVALPYRIENCLRGISITYYQKDLVESDILPSGHSVDYVWDDLNLPHKLVVQIADLHLLCEISIDKMCTWKPFFKMRKHKGMLLNLQLGKGFGAEKRIDESHGLELFKVGYEVYADGLTRVLRICESTDCYKEEKMHQPSMNIQFRLSCFAVHLLEHNKQVDPGELSTYSTIVVARLSNISLDSLITDQYKYNLLRIQSFNVDEKWQGAPFASMIRRNQLRDSGSNENILSITFILCPTSSNVVQVKYASIILQPIDLKVDEETLMRLVPFWRSSLSDSTSQSRQFYFKHFEIHPVKIIASFLPGNPYSSYTSAQETLRSLLHSVIKVPAVNNTVVELNGILLTHALVTSRELLIKCAQHYSWYVVRAVYRAKGSPLLPPAFASIFDDTASSSLDVFFDPSDGSISLPGLTLGMFKFIKKCVDSKGFSGTKRYFGDLGKSIKAAGSNALFAALTEISDSMLRGAEASGLNGMVNGFHQGILRLAMEPSLLGAAVLEGGPDRKIILDRSPGVDELYIEGYLQAMLDVMFKQEYLRVRVIDNQVILKNLPPNSSVINEIVENVKSFLVSKALLKGDASTASRPLRHLRSESEWRIGPTVLTLCEHLFVSFAIRMLRKHTNKFLGGIRWNGNGGEKGEASSEGSQQKTNRRWAVGKFVFSGLIAYLDGRLCRHIPNPIVRRIVSGFLLSFLDKKDGE